MNESKTLADPSRKPLPTACCSPFLDLRCCDNMELMSQYPDNHFDLAIVDPPYGIGVDGGIGGGVLADKSGFEKKGWDSQSPPVEYFKELFRVSKNQIIWGANHFMEKVMRGSPSWIVWDKLNGLNYFADAELAYTSHKKPCRVFKFRWQGMLQGDMKDKEIKIHPTQKPVKLYNWILANYAEKGMKILDTHMGSGSIAIACHYAECYLTACELDQDYYREACKRIERETSQATLKL